MGWAYLAGFMAVSVIVRVVAQSQLWVEVLAVLCVTLGIIRMVLAKGPGHE